MNYLLRKALGGAYVTEAQAVEATVIVVVYHTGPALFESLRLARSHARVGHVVVVDNGSTPEDAARLRALAEGDDRLTLLQGHGNIGFARGANLGASAARGKWLVFLNPDAFLTPDCVGELIRAGEQSRRPCVVGARVLNHDGTEQRGARRGEVSPVTTLLTLTRLTALPALRKYEIHWEDKPAPDRPSEVPTISGACFCISREDFLAMGGFDRGYFLHVEDVDLCWRVRRQGGAVLFQPTAEVVHLGHTSLEHPVRVEYFKGLGLARYFRKRARTMPDKVVSSLLGPMIVAAAVARPMLRALVTRHGRKTLGRKTLGRHDKVSQRDFEAALALAEQPRETVPEAAPLVRAVTGAA